MKKRQWMALALIVIVVSSLLLPACSEPTTQPTTEPTTQPTTEPTTQPTTEPTTQPTTTTPSGDEPQYGGTLKIITTKMIPAFDAPVISGGPVESVVIPPLWDTILDYDKTGKLIPSLTTAEISPDGKTITLTMPEGIKFQDGTDCTVEAIKYHIENWKFLRYRFDYIESMDIIDPYTIRLNMSEVDNLLYQNLSILWGALNSPTAAVKETLEERIAGTGPFKLAEWVRDVHLKTVRNDNYWQEGLPYLDGLDIIFMADPVTAMISFEAGDAHVIRELTPQNAAELRDKGYKVQYCVGYEFVLVPDSKPGSHFSDKRVREAVEYAIDKEAVVDAFGYGFIEPVYQPVPPNRPTAYVPGLLERKYDPAKARELLADAGLADGFDTKIYCQTSDDKEVLATIQSYLADVGINAELEVLEPARFMEYGREGWTNGLRYYNTGVDLDPLSGYKAFYSDETAHFFSMDKPQEMIDALETARISTDPQEIEDLLKFVTTTLCEEALVLPMWTKPLICAMQDSVHDFNLATIDLHSWDAAPIWLSE